MTTNGQLPELSTASISRIEQGVFEAIRFERAPAHKSRPVVASASTRARARRRRWLTGIGVAAAFAVGVMVTAPILNGLSPTGSGGSTVATSTDQSQSGALDPLAEGLVMPGTAEVGLGGVMDQLIPGTAIDASPESSDAAAREVITTATATVEVADVSDGIAEISTIAEKSGGYVESTDVSRSADEAEPVDGGEAASLPLPRREGTGWISIRVPSAELTAVIAELDATGDVLASSVSRSDVTTQAIDLRARVEATKASVARLTELMGQSGSLNDLIQAEVALSDRQAQLESYEQQLTMLEDQVAMSSLSVSLTTAPAHAEPDPSGFGSGLLSGWNGLIASVNALVLVTGFLLPWLGVAAIVIMILLLIRRARRRTRDSEDEKA